MPPSTNFTSLPRPHTIFTRRFIRPVVQCSVSQTALPPAKKLKQSKLTFGVAAVLDLSTPSTSHSVPAPMEEDTNDPGEENTCTSECREHACDEYGPSPFQPKDLKAIERTRRKQGQKSGLHVFSSAWYVTDPWITLCTTRARVFCAHCRYCVGKGLSSDKKEKAFVTTGFGNWKKAHQRFQQHAIRCSQSPF